MTAAELISGYLHTLMEQGMQYLPVDEDARAILRSWMTSARGGGRCVSRQQPPLPSSAKAAPSLPEEGRKENAASRIGDYLRSALYAGEVPADSQQEDGDDIPFFRPAGNTPAEIWQHAARLLESWSPLMNLGTLRRKAVFGEGDRNADIMFVGEAPGFYDEQAGRPFQGDAGGKLDAMLKAMGLSRSQVYITYLVKFRPSLPHQTTNNRPPSKKEILYSSSILELETRLVRPKVIVALGVIAARGLLQQGELPLSAYQQQENFYHGIPVVVTHQPSYLLRTSNLEERRRLWEEMLRVMTFAGLPISAKQQGYFLRR